MLIDVLFVTSVAAVAFVIGYFFGFCVENNRRIESETEDLSWELPPLDEPLPFRITEGFDARQELIRNSNPDEA
jgi:hypothetical protein